MSPYCKVLPINFIEVLLHRTLANPRNDYYFTITHVNRRISLLLEFIVKFTSMMMLTSGVVNDSVSLYHIYNTALPKRKRAPTLLKCKYTCVERANDAPDASQGIWKAEVSLLF